MDFFNKLQKNVLTLKNFCITIKTRLAGKFCRPASYQEKTIEEKNRSLRKTHLLGILQTKNL